PKAQDNDCIEFDAPLSTLSEPGFTPRLEHTESLGLPTDPCSGPSSGVFHVQRVCRPGGSTRSNPEADNSCRHGEYFRACGHPETRPSTARRFRPCPLQQTGLHPPDANRLCRARASCGSYRAWEPPLPSNYSPKDRSCHPYLEPRTAIPIRVEDASQPKPHRRGRLRSRPKSRACCPSRRDTSHFASHARSSSRLADDSAPHQQIS